MARPQVSVVMTVHDGAAFLERAVSSIRRQHLERWELVVVDDASTDETPAVLAQLARSERRLVVERLPRNVGSAAAANAGLALARGDVIARLDADDEADPRRLGLQVALLEARPDVDVVGSACRVVDEAGGLRWTQAVPQGPVAIALRCAVSPPFVHSSVAWRRSAQLSYEPSFRVGLDAELWARVTPNLRCENVAEPLVDYRVWPGSVTARRPDEQRRAHDLVCGSVLRRLLERDVSAAQLAAFRAWVRREDARGLAVTEVGALVDELVAWARRGGLAEHEARRVLQAPVNALGQPGHVAPR